ncbi:MAG: uracil-DNA glycosylase family protein [Acidobacteriota bacterium]
MTIKRVLGWLYSGPRGNAPRVANPYRDGVTGLDRPGAWRARRRNLEAYLERVGPVRVVLVGEALGYRGGRFSGIAFTSERQLAGPPGARLPWAHDAFRATSTRPSLWTEPSGTIVWRALGGRPDGVLLWNTFPWHPHGPPTARPASGDGRLTNRTPEAVMVHENLRVLGAVLDWAQPRRVAAVGRVAAGALATMGLECEPLRHPARGGAVLFSRQLASLLDREAC